MSTVVNNPLTPENLTFTSQFAGFHDNRDFTVTLGGRVSTISGAGVREITESVLGWWEELGRPWNGGEIHVYGVENHYDPGFCVSSYILELLEQHPEDFLPATSSGMNFQNLKSIIEALPDEMHGKLFQRIFADQSGIFAQPDRRDYADYKLHYPQYVSFNAVDFSAFPIDEMLQRQGQRVSYMFENPVDGFVFLPGRSGFRFWTRNNTVRRVWDTTDSDMVFSDRVNAFLKTLSEGFVIDKISLARIPHFQAALVDEFSSRLIAAVVLSSGKDLYIKDAMGGAGRMVLKTSGTLPDVRIESDSGELSQVLGSLSARNEALKAAISGLDEGSVPAEAIRRFENLVEPDPLNVLSRAISTMIHPIAEEVIPFELVEGKRAEFRIVSMLVPGEESFSIPGHYTKVSDNMTSANISHGGHGERTLDVLIKMYRQRFPDLSEEDLLKRAEVFLEEMLSDVRAFSDEYYEYSCDELGMPISRHFAVDLCPAWDEEQNDFDLYLIEVNMRHYGIKGLKESDPEAAARVLELQKLHFSEDILPFEELPTRDDGDEVENQVEVA